jgi:hypothetical protein
MMGFSRAGSQLLCRALSPWPFTDSAFAGLTCFGVKLMLSAAWFSEIFFGATVLQTVVENEESCADQQ